MPAPVRKAVSTAGRIRPTASRNLSDRAVGRTFRLARPTVQRTPRNPSRADVDVRPTRPWVHTQRPIPGLDHKHRRIRHPTLTITPARTLHCDAPKAHDSQHLGADLLAVPPTWKHEKAL